MISVIMASYLGDYPGAALNREEKFKRAINSFLIQNIGELIIVSDGCDKTNEIVESLNCPQIKLIKLEKQPIFSGLVRQAGIEQASYNWICYLDTDDEFTPNYLSTIVSHIDNHDWYFCDAIVNQRVRHSEVKLAKIGTCHIIHKKILNIKWPDGYGHDFFFIQQLGNNYKKIDYAGYIVHHVPGVYDH